MSKKKRLTALSKLLIALAIVIIIFIVSSIWFFVENDFNCITIEVISKGDDGNYIIQSPEKLNNGYYEICQ